MRVFVMSAFVATFLTMLSIGCASLPRPVSPVETLSFSTLLPENPCDVFTAAEAASITGLDVEEGRRVPSIRKVVEAQNAGHEPGAGRICSYETSSDFGAIAVLVPLQAERHAADYWASRERYFLTYPGSARTVADLGIDAWLAGGASLSVLARGDDYFTISTQFYRRESGQLLSSLARAALNKP